MKSTGVSPLCFNGFNVGVDRPAAHEHQGVLKLTFGAFKHDLNTAVAEVLGTACQAEIAGVTLNVRPVADTLHAASHKDVETLGVVHGWNRTACRSQPSLVCARLPNDPASRMQGATLTEAMKFAMDAAAR